MSETNIYIHLGVLRVCLTEIVILFYVDKSALMNNSWGEGSGVD